MKTNWKFEQELFESLKQSIEKGNKPATTLKKIKCIWNNYSDLINYSESYTGIHNETLKDLKNAAKALDIIKTGYIQLPDYAVVIKVSEIESFSSKKNGQIHINHNGKTSITENEDFYDMLKILLT
jgi:hypothetical protein